ncbi:MAG: porin family protein [Flavobacteriaceae bacterium]|jgi:hypothetical protein|nr:porin family protein [Flavobacteriaceae bacterium]
MIKKIALSAITLITLCTMNAQDVAFGIKGGGNIANTCSPNTDPRISFHFGAVVELPLSYVFSIQPELTYSAQGARNSDISINTNFINVPIMAKYYVIEYLSLELGPQIGFLIKSEAKNQNNTVIRNSKDRFKPIEYGVNLGLGYKLEEGFNFAMRFNFGLSNIYDLENSDAEWKNRVFQFSFGYNF